MERRGQRECDHEQEEMEGEKWTKRKIENVHTLSQFTFLNSKTQI